MSKKINVKLAICMLFLFSAVSLIASPSGSFTLITCNKGDVQYKPSGDCGTSINTCCEKDLWSGWDKDCKDLTYTWNCRQVPKSYCASGSLLMSNVSGSISGQTCSTYGKEGFSSGTTDDQPALASGANTACYQCKCGDFPTNPECNCSGLSSTNCTVQKNGAAYVGSRKCLANCLWDDCYAVDSLEGDYCGLTPGKTYPCTPAAYPENGGYQICENSYTDPGQLQISACKACGENACLARYGDVGIDLSGGTYTCVNKPSGGSDTKGKYNCTAAKCSGMGMSSSPWTCTAKAYTSCNSGYKLVGTSCVDEGSGTIKPIDPTLPELTL